MILQKKKNKLLIQTAYLPAETVDSAEPEKDTEKNDPPEVRKEEAPDKCKKYTREDFLARRHGKER